MEGETSEIGGTSAQNWEEGKLHQIWGIEATGCICQALLLLFVSACWKCEIWHLKAD